MNGILINWYAKKKIRNKTKSGENYDIYLF